jgi:hypothetical protein
MHLSISSGMQSQVRAKGWYANNEMHCRSVQLLRHPCSQSGSSTYHSLRFFFQPPILPLYSICNSISSADRRILHSAPGTNTHRGAFPSICLLVEKNSLSRDVCAHYAQRVDAAPVWLRVEGTIWSVYATASGDELSLLVLASSYAPRYHIMTMLRGMNWNASFVLSSWVFPWS